MKTTPHSCAQWRGPLIEDGFDVQVISKHDALELRGLEGPDVGVFNVKATAAEKTTYNDQFRMLNPNCIIVDVDEFVGNVVPRGTPGQTATPRARSTSKRLSRPSAIWSRSRWMNANICAMDAKMSYEANGYQGLHWSKGTAQRIRAPERKPRMVSGRRPIAD